MGSQPMRAVHPPLVKNERDLRPYSGLPASAHAGPMPAALQDSPKPPTREPTRTNRRSLRLPIGVGAAILIVAIALAVLVFRDDSRSSNALATQQLVSLQQACPQWSGSSAPSVANMPGPAACTAMTGWMGQQLQSGRMTGAMMWGSASTMRGTCRQWVASVPSAASDDAQGWCDAMVTWMGQRIGGWDNWMMNGRMMG